MLWDRGFWTPEGGENRTEDAFQSRRSQIYLGRRKAHRQLGTWCACAAIRFGGKRINWLLVCHRDADANTADGDSLLSEDRSVASGRTMQQIAAGKGRRPKPFMLATSTPGKATR